MFLQETLQNYMATWDDTKEHRDHIIATTASVQSIVKSDEIPGPEEVKVQVQAYDLLMSLKSKVRRGGLHDLEVGLLALLDSIDDRIAKASSPDHWQGIMLHCLPVIEKVAQHVCCCCRCCWQWRWQLLSVGGWEVLVASCGDSDSSVGEFG